MEPHRSIQDIVPPTRSRVARAPLPSSPENHPPVPPVQPPHREEQMSVNPRRPTGFFGFAVVAGVVLVVLAVGIVLISTVFHRAYVTVTPYTFAANVQASFETSPSSETLPYQKTDASDTATKSVPATGSQHVENHASGTVTFYNAYSTTPQRLITNTRISTQSGLVYRAHAPVIIPGYTMKAGLKVPGTIDTVVYADQAGDTYNIGSSDFTIPGLKGSKQYTLIYAKSIGAMAGGFIGQQAVVDPSVRSQTVDALKATLDRSLRAKIHAGAPAGTLVFDSTITITYTEAPDSMQGNNAVISVSGAAVAPAVSEVAFARAVASQAQVSYQGPMTIDNPDKLNVQVDAPQSLGSDTPIHLTASGTAQLVASFDSSALAKDLVGKDKKNIKDVLSSYPAISNIDVKIYPFWENGIPNQTSKLKITVVSPTT